LGFLNLSHFVPHFRGWFFVDPKNKYQNKEESESKRKMHQTSQNKKKNRLEKMANKLNNF